MKKSSVNWYKVVFVSSLALNIVFIVGYIILLILSRSVSDVARINSFQTYYCSTHYQAMLDYFDATNDTEHAAQAKDVFAMTVCLKNYKTGQPLDLTPLQKQVEVTSK